MLPTQIIHKFKQHNVRTFGSLDEAKEFINNKILLDVPSNQVDIALGIFQNTLLEQLEKEMSDGTN